MKPSLSREDLTQFRVAYAAFSRGDNESALTEAQDLLTRYGDEPMLLDLAGHSLLKLERPGMALQFYKRLSAMLPKAWEIWNNLGRCYHEMARYEEAAGCFFRALELAPHEFSPACNLFQAAIYRCDIDSAEEWATKAAKAAVTGEQLLKIERALHFIHFGRRNWPEAWRTFDLDLGSKSRRDKPYVGEPRWDGTPGKRVVIYGEQGLGDEILFASMYPDALKDCEGILECDKRLEGLFCRSFPEAKAVYGTRHDRELFWPNEQRIDARCAAGSLGRLYRNADGGGFRRECFLAADPVRQTGYRAILATLPGRKIGIAWNGGTWSTRSKERSLPLLALLEGLHLGRSEVSWVSLEYQDPTEEIAACEAETGVKVHHWRHATQTKDYDDTAALVAELDAVVSVTTTVALLAGALGKETHVLVPPHPTWHWGIEGEMPWLDVKLYRRTGPSWEPQIRQIAEALCIPS